MKLRNKKTGEVVDLSIFGITLNIRKEEQPTYHSIEQLCEDWEDLTPTKPLIKDEKIRKAVRAWAEANGVDTSELKVSKGSNNTAIVGWVKGRFGGLSIDFETRQVEELEDGKKYTIEELCGSEEIEILEPTYTTIEEKEKLKENSVERRTNEIQAN
jgi:hypothetical protein